MPKKKVKKMKSLFKNVPNSKAHVTISILMVKIIIYNVSLIPLTTSIIINFVMTTK